MSDPGSDYASALADVRQAVLRGAAETSPGRQTRLANAVESLTTRLAKIAGRPDEPTESVVRFTKFFGFTKRFDYAARRVNGQWHITGHQRQTSVYSWEDLLDWLDDRWDSIKTLRVASEWRELT